MKSENRMIKVNYTIHAPSLADLDEFFAMPEMEKEEDSFFAEAREGFLGKPRNWCLATELLFDELDDFAINKLVAANWYDEVELGRLVKEHWAEAWASVEESDEYQEELG
tara:strand:+ start:2788 stop:3117 length:330 start_codon:yes stop_codon:yes gene_type:complete